jgi:dTDP-4-amino-4,6-dideoxygalactose transaminase
MYLIGEEEKKEVIEVLESGYLSRFGSEDNPKFLKKVMTFEREFAEKMGMKYGLAVNSGTSSLICCLRALGVGPGVEVIVPGYTFLASITTIIAAGGEPVLAEVDESLTIDPNDIERKITEKTKVLLPVHMLGNPADMDRILKIAKKHGLAVLEDACQAVGGSYKGKRLGSLGDMGAYSLNIYKVINAGDAGILCTNDRDLYEKAFAYHDHGHSPLRADVSEIGNRKIIGVNMRMNELTGACMLAQLRKLDSILDLLKKKKIKFKESIKAANIKNMDFRRINDEGECHTVLTVRFETKAIAEKVARTLGTKTIEKSGWHVYNNAEHLLSYRNPDGSAVATKHELPQTDDLLERSINLSVGVVDPGIGTDFGINILSEDEEIERAAAEFVKKIKPITDG